MDFESLIFDIDGTLWDSRAIVAKGYNKQLKKEGLEHLSVNPDILKTVFGKMNTEIANILFASLPEEERYPLLERCIEQEDRALEEDECDVAYPKVKETLEKLHEKHRLFIVSNGQYGYPRLCMEKLGLTHLFSGDLCFGQTLTCKGETILKLMKDHNITSACYIGDTQGDYEATLVANIPFIWAAYGFGNPAGAAAQITDIRQLPGVLEAL